MYRKKIKLTPTNTYGNYIARMYLRKLKLFFFKFAFKLLTFGRPLKRTFIIFSFHFRCNIFINCLSKTAAYDHNSLNKRRNHRTFSLKSVQIVLSFDQTYGLRDSALRGKAIAESFKAQLSEL